jgi:hypothetical protein
MGGDFNYICICGTVNFRIAGDPEAGPFQFDRDSGAKL